MSKRTEVHRARMARREAAKQRQMLVTGGLVTVIVGVLVLILSSTGAASPAVAQERLDLDPILGNPDAPVTIIEYGAYACPACRSWHQARIVEQILAEYPGQVRFVFRDFPVINPPYDRMAAALAQCALDQSQEGFWTLHDALYTTAVPGSSQDELIRLGEQMGLNGDALRACAEANTHYATVQYDETRARNLGLPGTPSFLVNDIRLFNATPDTLRAAVEQALAAR